MEKYAVVKEKLKKLSVEQTRGDSYDPFLPARKEVKNAHSKQPKNRPPQDSTVYQQFYQQGAHGNGDRARAMQTGEQLAFDVEPANADADQAAAFSVARAIGTLQHRSQQEGQYVESADDTAPSQPFVTEPAAYEDDLIAQEIQRLEMRAININNRSQQQAEDILDLKRAAQQAAIAFARQGIQDHPQLDVITHFFDRYAASHVPIIERDDCGHFTLGDYSINLRRAEEEAMENAAVLRGSRHPEALPAVMPFAQPLVGKTATKRRIKPISKMARRQRQQGNRKLALLQAQFNHVISGLGKLWQISWRSIQANAPQKPASDRLATGQYIENYASAREFSFVDGAIWFSAAAVVARVMLKTVVVFPIFQPVLWIAPLGLFCTAIYLMFVAKSTDSTLMYRLVLVALGLFLSASL